MRPPDSWKTARVTLAFALLNVLVWLVAQPPALHGTLVAWGGFVPAEVGAGDGVSDVLAWLTPLTSAFIHANWLHLGVNLLMFVYCGRPTEAVLGPVALAILYLVGAYAAAAAQYFVDPQSGLPMIGASGAVSAVLGAYAMLFGRNKVKIANPTLALWVHALWLLAAWIVLQLLVGIILGGAGIAIAFAAHIGGFFVGLLLARPLLLFRYRKA